MTSPLVILGKMCTKIIADNVITSADIPTVLRVWRVLQMPYDIQIRMKGIHLSSRPNLKRKSINYPETGLC